MSDSIYDVVHRYGLDRAQAAQLWDSATEQPPAQWPQQLWRILAWVSALLLGAGLIFWVAAQWPQQTRLFKLYLLQAAVAVPVLGALCVPRLRAAALVLATLALGALLAFVGQTYQTGADAWQLFATWAALALLWVVVARNGLLWALWWCIAAAGLALWQWTGHAWAALAYAQPPTWQHHASFLLPWLALWLGPLALPRLGSVAVPSAPIARVLGAGVALLAWTSYACSAVLVHGGMPLPWLGGCLGVALVAWQAWRWRQMLVLSLALLAANILWLIWVGRNVLDGAGLGEQLAFPLLTLLTAASVGWSAHWLYRLQKEGAA